MLTDPAGLGSSLLTGVPYTALWPAISSKALSSTSSSYVCAEWQW